MNRSLRKAHLRRAVALALVLPIGIGAALVARPSGAELQAPVTESQLDARARALVESTRGPAVRERVGEAVVLLRTLVEFPGTKGLLELHPASTLVAPDVLVYWAEGERLPAAGDGLPLDARLLGSYSGSSAVELPLPDEARDAAGALVFFSLARGEVVGSIAYAGWGMDA